MENIMLNKWKTEMKTLLDVRYPTSSDEVKNRYLDSIITSKYKNEVVKFYNNYNGEVKASSCASIEDFYYSDAKPITTEHGVLFQQGDNPSSKMLNKLKAERKVYKGLRDDSDADSDDYKMYDLYQGLKKVAMNSYYGASGARSSLFYNLHCALSVTGKGQAIISTSTQAFEAFLTNNSVFLSNDECYIFIKNVINEKPNRKFEDDIVLDCDVTIEMVLDKLISTYEKPDKANVNMINRMLMNLSQEELNRLYYKNNIYEFCRNRNISNLIRDILKDAREFVNPNYPPKNIEKNLKTLWELVAEYVFYNYMVFDRVMRLKYKYRKAVVVIDTDSNMLNLDPWLDFVNNEILDDEFEEEYYDPKDLRLNTLNTLVYLCGEMISEVLKRFLDTSNIPKEKWDTLGMKNEYLYKRMIVSTGKKNYTGTIEYKEGKWMNYKLDVKGLPLDKISSNAEASSFFKNILRHDMLMSEEIDIADILNKLQNFQEEMKASLECGEKRFLKPTSVKPSKFYDNPLGQQGCRAVMNWNIVYPDREIELPDSVSIVKMTMTRPEDLELIKGSYPEIYHRIKEEIFESSEDKISSKGLYVLAIPRDEDVVPEWARPFIDTDTIIHDNMKNIVKILEVLDIDPISVTSADEHFSNIVRF